MSSKDPITLEVIRNAAIYISEEMGLVLRNTAYSPNIKDRLDHTCAVLAPDGRLVAQAEHIPVHIGSMAIGVENTIKYLRENNIHLESGDIIVVNDPYIAGTHLNDVTLLKPIYIGSKLVAILANKAHHVDVGGAVPGSIGGNVAELHQEGIVIPPVKLFDKGVLNKSVLDIFMYNVRTPKYLKGDLNAQLASLNIGEKRIIELSDKYGVEVLADAWEYIIQYTEEYTRNRIRGLEREGVYKAIDFIELPYKNYLEIKVSLSIEEDILVDYDGTSSQVDYPINAVYGVTVAATVYALKSVIDPEMPINHGFQKVVKVNVPRGTFLNPIPPAPVSGGNLETSQRIVDTLLKALSRCFPNKVPAASCGSMNNIMVGGMWRDRSRWAFYETIGGGSGGRPGEDGVDGVHTNMTNTLNTPIEVLEKEYPILFVKYELREDSGGPGKYRGGLGITRVFRMLGDAVLTIMSDRVEIPPWGLHGGMPGKPGEHVVIRADGESIQLSSKYTVNLNKGDIVYINTPGGGGYGNPCERDRGLLNEDILEGKISLKDAREFYCYHDEFDV